MKNYSVNLSNPLFLKYFVVIVVDLFKSNKIFKQKVIDSFIDLPKEVLDFNQNTSWNESHVLMFYINKNLTKFKYFLLNEYYKDKNLFSLESFDKKYANSINYDNELFLRNQIYVKPILNNFSSDELLTHEFNWKN